MSRQIEIPVLRFCSSGFLSLGAVDISGQILYLLGTVQCVMGCSGVLGLHPLGATPSSIMTARDVSRRGHVSPGDKIASSENHR